MASVKYSRALSRFPAQEGGEKGKERAVNYEHTHMQTISQRLNCHIVDIISKLILSTYVRTYIGSKFNQKQLTAGHFGYAGPGQLCTKTC